MSVGTTGESATLDVEEHSEVIRRTIDVAAGRVPIIAGTGANSTTEAIHLTEAAKAAGADAALLVTPYYNKPPQEGLYRHFKAVAEAVATSRRSSTTCPAARPSTCCPPRCERLAEVPDIVGIKEAKGDLDRVRELVALRPARFRRSTPATTPPPAPASCCGFHGDISVTANVAPEAWPGMCAAALAGDAEAAAAIDADLAACTARCSSSRTRSRSSGRSPRWG